MRVGLRYVRGLQQIAAESLVQARQTRPFSSIENLALRVPELNRRESAHACSNRGAESYRRYWFTQA